MGNKQTKSSPDPNISSSETFSARQRRLSLEKNTHNVQSDLIVHIIPTKELDCNYDHASNPNDINPSMQIPLGECTDEQLIAELTRRKLDLQANITEDFVKKTYDFGAFLGRGASGDVVVGVHKATKKQYAIKVVKRNSSMNDADSMSTEIEILKRVSFRHLVCMRELFETPQCLWIVLDLVTVR